MRLQHLLLLLSCTSIVANLLDNAKAGDLAGIKVDLANDEQDIEETSKDGYTALIYATAKGHEDVVKYLIQQGANTNAVDDIGTSVLSFALKKEEYSIASMLKKAGATKEGKVTQSDADDAAKDETPPTTTPPKKTKKKKTKTKPIEEPENTQWLDQVKHLKDDEFTMFKQFNPRFLAFFYAPWCGHCKAAKPEFGAAAGEATIPLVAFDCTKDAKSTCEQYSVSSFPQIKYFDSSYKAQEKSQGEEYIAYEGGRTAKALLKFILRQDPDYIKPPFENLTPEDWGSKESGLVIHMNDDDFDSFRSKKNRFLSMFYAPWCGHCKQAKPDFAVASQKFRRSMPFLAMDCTSEGTETCQKLNITSYPSFYYFNADSDPEDASAHFATQRSSGAYITYVEKKLSEMDAIENDKGGEINYKKLRVKALRKMLKDRGVKCRGCTEKLHFIERVQETIHLPIKSKKIYKKGGKTLIQEKREKVLAVNAEKGWNIETYGNGNVIHSYDGHFQEVLLKEKKQTMVVFFYAPWCGHCKQAKPDIVQVSNELLDYNNPIPYVAIDAEGSKSLASLYGISSFPTWKVWIKGELIDSKEAFGDSGPPRGTTDMLTFMMQLHDPSWKPETSDEDEQPSKKKKKSKKKKNKAEVIGKQLLNGAKKGSLEEVEAAINAGADIEERSKDEYTALIYATAKGHANVVVYLIEEGANVNAVDKYGTSALEYASKKGYEKIFTMLIDAGAMEGNRDGDEDDDEEEEEL